MTRTSAASERTNSSPTPTPISASAATEQRTPATCSTLRSNPSTRPSTPSSRLSNSSVWSAKELVRAGEGLRPRILRELFARSQSIVSAHVHVPTEIFSPEERAVVEVGFDFVGVGAERRGAGIEAGVGLLDDVVKLPVAVEIGEGNFLTNSSFLISDSLAVLSSSLSQI